VERLSNDLQESPITLYEPRSQAISLWITMQGWRPRSSQKGISGGHNPTSVTTLLPCSKRHASRETNKLSMHPNYKAVASSTTPSRNVIRRKTPVVLTLTPVTRLQRHAADLIAMFWIILECMTNTVDRLHIHTL
jgi:hypothetical protein